MRELFYQSIILKKQPYNEADEIITVFTKDIGKIRVLAKSAKLAKSKLQYGLQTLFVVTLRLTHGSMAKVIGTEVVESFPRLRENYEAIKVAIYGMELLMKFTPDEQPNERLFLLFVDFLRYLDTPQLTDGYLQLGFAKFKIDFLNTIGNGVSYPEVDHIFFSNSKGGFTKLNSADAVLVDLVSINIFIALSNSSFPQVLKHVEVNIQELQNLLSRFVTYQLERDLKSERYLHM